MDDPSSLFPEGPAGHVDMPDQIDVGKILGRVEGMKMSKKLRAVLEEATVKAYEQAKLGRGYRDWYDRFGDAVLGLARKFGVDPVRVSRVTAFLSQTIDPTSNLGYAHRALEQRAAGETVRVGRFPNQQSGPVEGILEGGDWNGLKTNSFAQNIIHSVFKLSGSKPPRSLEIDPRAVTVDRHIADLFEATGKSVSQDDYHVIAEVIRGIADELGWEPMQVQAAMWVPWKSRAKAIKQRARRGEAGEPTQEEIARYGEASGQAGEPARERYQFDLVHEPVGRAGPPEWERLFSLTETQGGGTWKVSANGVISDQPETIGWNIPRGEFERRVRADQATGADIASYWRDHRGMLDDHGHYLGTWLDGEWLYMDVNRHYGGIDEGTAIARGKKEGQLAVWDIEKGRAVETGLSLEEADAIKEGLRLEARNRTP
jgi:hypothetical protein